MTITTNNEKPNLVRICGQMTDTEIQEMDKHYKQSGYTIQAHQDLLPVPQQQQQQQQQQQPTPIINQPVHLIVAIPTGASHDFEWSRDFGTKFLMRMVPRDSGLIFENRYGIAQARETLANTFINTPNATHLLFFDSDVLPIELHGINTLIQDSMMDPKKYIVSGIYYNSLYSGINAWVNEVALKLDDPYITQSADPVIPVDKVGMGYTIIRKDLFSLLNLEERPLFFYKIMEGNVMESEDFVFFKKLKKYNIRPYIDTRVTAMHIKRCKVGPRGEIQF